MWLMDQQLGVRVQGLVSRAQIIGYKAVHQGQYS